MKHIFDLLQVHWCTKGWRTVGWYSEVADRMIVQKAGTGVECRLPLCRDVLKEGQAFGLAAGNLDDV